MCAGSYTVAAAKFGINVTLADSPPATYYITASCNDTQIGLFTLEHSGNQSALHIPRLKPHTEYTITVSSNGSVSTDCGPDSKTVTTEMMSKC